MYNDLPDAPWIREAELLGMPPYDDDPWDRDCPGWKDIRDLIEEWQDDKIPGYTRDYIEGDGDLMMEVYEAGLLADYIDPAARMDDPDDEWREVDRVFSVQWQNNDLMTDIWYWLPDKRKKDLIEWLMSNPDLHGIRDLYDEKNGWEEE